MEAALGDLKTDLKDLRGDAKTDMKGFKGDVGAIAHQVRMLIAAASLVCVVPYSRAARQLNTNICWVAVFLSKAYHLEDLSTKQKPGVTPQGSPAPIQAAP